MVSPAEHDALPELTDADLIRRFTLEGVPEAFAVLARRYRGLVYGTAQRILPDSGVAEDVTQEVFIKLAHGLSRVRPEALGAWLHRTARNEALNFRRTESRRRRREHLMSEDMQTRAMEPPDLPDVRTEAREHLDAALDHLNDRERRYVLERYHQGQTIRGIAAEAGKTEDAARMVINRALEKMSRFLRRRGVTVSVAGLASGLAAEFTRTAPPFSRAAEAALHAAALSTAGRPAAGSAINYIITALMTKSAVTTGSALLLFLLAAGGGWLAYRQNSDGGADSTASSGTSGGRTAGENRAEAAGKVQSAGARLSADKIEGLLARLEEIRAKRQTITGRIPQDRKSPPDAATVTAVFADIEALNPEIKEILSVLGPADLPAAVTAVLQMNGSGKAYALEQLFKRWGELDAAGALQRANELPESLQDTARIGLARGWGGTDPRAALKRAGELHPGDESRRTRFVREVFTGWMQTDAAAAVLAAADLPVDDQRHAAKAFDDLLRSPSQRAAATEALGKLEDDVLRAEIAENVAGDWAKFDGPAAAAWFDKLPWETPHAGVKAALEIAEGWGEIPGQMAAALDWLWPRAPLDMRMEILEDTVARRWARSDRAAAEAWLKKQNIPSGSLKDLDRRAR